LIGLHIAGVALDRLLHPESGTLRSIFGGYKRLDAAPATMNPLQQILAALLLAASLALPLAALPQGSPLTRTVHAPIDYPREHPLFAEECAACHTLYPPHLLPRESWRKLMAGLDDHFGDDASLEEPERRSILAYLERNAAERSTREAALYLRQSIARSSKKDIIAMTETPYWKEKHATIDPARFRSDGVRSRANCKACHPGIERGSLADHEIRLPKEGG
jgi:hypothetical protein